MNVLGVPHSNIAAIAKIPNTVTQGVTPVVGERGRERREEAERASVCVCEREMKFGFNYAIAVNIGIGGCGVATISRLLKITGLFCRISSLL